MEDSEGELEEEQQQQETNNFHININKEQNNWYNYILKYFVYLIEKCPKCGLNKITVGKINNIINPLRLVCNNYKCKYRCSIKKLSFLKKCPKQPASTSIIMEILRIFKLEQQNETQIKSYL